MRAARLDKMHDIVIHRLDSVHVVVGDNPNYPASCQVFKYLDRGFMFAINGTDFYRYYGQPGKVADLCARLGVKRLDGYMTPEHAEACRRYLSESAMVDFEPAERVEVAEGVFRDMVWVVVRPLWVDG